MTILLVNDDGIASAGLIALARMAAALGEVWVVAPQNQCSGMSQRISVLGSIALRAEPNFPVAGVHAYSIDGTPADCVRVALACVLPCRPDVVFSGINNGFNIGTDILYSGTVGAATEAMTHGLPAIAFSSAMDDLSVPERFLPELARELVARPLPPYMMWNVNFPPCAPDQVKGVWYDRAPSRLQYYETVYTPVPGLDGQTLQLSSHARTDAEEGSDIHAVFHNYISVGTLSNDLLRRAFTEDD